MERKRIGDFFVEQHILTEEEKKHVLEYAQTSGKSFGEAGLELGVLTREDMIQVFGPGFEIDFFYLDSRYFPQATKNALTLEEMLRYGAMPLGYKKKAGFLSKAKVLNVGFLDPANAESVQAVETLVKSRLAGEQVTGIKIFLLLADQYLDVLRTVYGQNDASLRGQELDSVLRLHLEA